MKFLTKILKKTKLYFCTKYYSDHWVFPIYEDAEKSNYDKISDLKTPFLILENYYFSKKTYGIIYKILQKDIVWYVKLDEKEFSELK